MSPAKSIWTGLALAASGFAAGAAAQIMVVPAAPRPLETVRIEAPGAALPSLFSPGGTSVTVNGTRITVRLGFSDWGGVPPPNPNLYWPLGQFDPGTYQVEVLAGVPPQPLQTLHFTVEPRSANGPLYNYTDLWWNPQESGWGLNLVQHGSGKIFGTWFVYDEDGTPAWYVMPDGRWNHSTEYVGELYRVTGPVVGPSFNPAAVQRVSAGELRLNFQGADHALASFGLHGRPPLVKSITRQSF